jgi:hypothetical protein
MAHPLLAATAVLLLRLVVAGGILALLAAFFRHR